MITTINNFLDVHSAGESNTVYGFNEHIVIDIFGAGVTNWWANDRYLFIWEDGIKKVVFTVNLL